jgi:hypothetical protein
MTDLLQLDPVALIILFVSGAGVIYVVRIFTAAQTIREREMWTAMQSMMENIKNINDSWLATYKSQGEKSNDSVQVLSGDIASLTTQMAELTAAINKSIESGANLQGASNLMMNILRNGDGRRSKDETK